MNEHSKTESAFGRPAQWTTALPAVVVGLVAVLLAAYGEWGLPSKLPNQYAQALAEFSTRYERESGNPAFSANNKWIDTAGELDVIYSRLVSLEKGSPTRYWEWIGFLQRHSSAIRGQLQKPAGDIRDDLREGLASQAAAFEAKARKLLEQLAVGASEFRDPALLLVTEGDFHQGMSQFGIPNAEEIANEMRLMIDQRVEHSTTNEDFSKKDLNSARLLWLQLSIEAAWQSPNGRTLRVSQTKLDTLWMAFQTELSRTDFSEFTTNRWLSSEQLLRAYFDQATQALVEDQSVVAGKLEFSEWQDRLATLQLAALEADWQDVAFQLSRSRGAEDPAVVMGLARTICRLACSPMARKDSAWCRQFDVGLLMVAQLAPHLPEFNELIWEIALARAESEQSTDGVAARERLVAPQIVETIATGQSAWLKHSVFALSATIDGKLDLARTHLQLIQRSTANLSIVARTALWRAQRAIPLADKEADAAVLHLAELMELAVEIEPDSGLNWFVLGTLQHQCEQYEAAVVALEKAQTLLGEVDAIREMLKAVRKKMVSRS